MLEIVTYSSASVLGTRPSYWTSVTRIPPADVVAPPGVGAARVLAVLAGATGAAVTVVAAESTLEDDDKASKDLAEGRVVVVVVASAGCC